MELLTYKCPNCMGAITFNGEQQEFKCEFCDSVFTIEQLKQYEEDLKKAERPPEKSEFNWQESENEEISHTNVYSCEFCGAQIVTDENTAASECPYCNNPVVMKRNLSGVYRPDCVIPFSIGKEDAVKALEKFYKNKKLLPNAFVNDNRVQQIKGMYVPFWLFDCAVDADVDFNATTTRMWSDNNFNYTATNHYHVRRTGTLNFERIPADGSSKMDNAYMDAIEPFDYSKLTEFKAAYLSGYLADKYDVGSADNVDRINKRIENSTVDVFRQTVSGYETVTNTDTGIKVKQGKARYALLPVWMLNTKYNDKMYTFAMNGQTGKFVGKLPIDKGKAAKYFIGIAAACAVVGQAVLLLLNGGF